jgi:hypothetical protein
LKEDASFKTHTTQNTQHIKKYKKNGTNLKDVLQLKIVNLYLKVYKITFPVADETNFVKRNIRHTDGK